MSKQILQPWHTPGPWEAVELSDSKLWTVLTEWTIDGRGEGVANVFGGSRTRANALLIAAAPDAYAIIRAEYDANKGFQTLPMGYPADRANAIRNYIAKAEGGAA